MIRLSFARSAAVTILALTVAGCGAVRVNSYAERGFDLQRYHTFGWGPADQHSTGDPRLDNRSEGELSERLAKARAVTGWLVD